MLLFYFVMGQWKEAGVEVEVLRALKDSDEYNIVILVLIFPHEDNLAHWLLFCFLLLSTCNVHTSCSKLMALIAYPNIKKCSIWWVVTVAPFNLSNTCKYQELYPSASHSWWKFSLSISEGVLHQESNCTLVNSLTGALRSNLNSVVVFFYTLWF